MVQTWKFPISLFLDQIGLEKMFDDHLVRKQALLGYKHIDFFPKGLTHDFAQKFENSSWFVFG